MDYRHQLITLAERFGAKRGVSEARTANLVGCDSRFFARLREGGGCRVDTLHRVVQFFSDHWPDGAMWPDCIARPPKQQVAA